MSISDPHGKGGSTPIFIPIGQRKIRPKQISYIKVGKVKGQSRIWLEGLRLEESGFKKGTPIRFNAVNALAAATIEAVSSSKATHSVSGRIKRNTEDEYTPIIDIANMECTELLEGINTLRVMYYNSCLLLQAHSNDLNAQTSIEDLEINTQARSLTMASIGIGGGVFTHAIKSGLAETGIDLELSWCIDIEKKYLQNVLDNTGSVGPRTIVVEGDISDVETNLLTPVNILLISNACTGASKAGKAKNQIEHAEEHDSAGLMILKTLEIIEKYQPPVIWHENVVEYLSSASGALLLGKLQHLGYNIQHGVYAGEMGTLEDRKRSILLATHKNIKFDLQANLIPVMRKEQKLSDVMDEVPLDSDVWKPYEYLTQKAIRDKQNGKGFRLQRLTGEESKIGVIGRGAAKARSTEPFFIHPTNPNLFRLPTVGEHARFMKIPVELVSNVSKTVAHEILGQSGSYALVKAIGVMTGKELNALYNDEPIRLDQIFIQERENINIAKHSQLVSETSFDLKDENEVASKSINLSLF